MWSGTAEKLVCYSLQLQLKNYFDFYLSILTGAFPANGIAHVLFLIYIFHIYTHNTG